MNKNNLKSYVHYIRLITIKNKILFLSILLIFVVGMISVPRIFAVPQVVKSVEIFSEKLDYEKKDSGAWKVTKSAMWKEKGIAEITFDVDTIMKSNTKYTDILFVLDVSGSMSGEKLDRVKADTIELITSLLSNDRNKAGLITFDSNSQIISSLTNNREELIEKVNSLTTTGCTNYYQALVNVDTVLKDYVKEKDRECIVLFLTDGYPNESTPNEEGQYNYLKSQYPFITINGIQYEMGSSILDPVKKITDNQYIADMETLNNILFEASISPVTYDNFEIIDYVDTNYFYVESENDIKVNQGSITFDKQNQKFIWKMDNLKSGSKAKMTINAKLKEELIGEGGFYPTNEKEEIKSKIDKDEENVTSLKTPVLADKYRVIYDGNEPDDCSVEGVPEERTYSVFDTVGISDSAPICEGYQFKGWKITTNNVKTVNGDYFIMPEEDVTIKANWSKLDITKSMEGTVREKLDLYGQIKLDYQNNNHARKYTGPTDTFTGKEDIYYYYGETPNNNVLFGGFCWRMYRTTDTGGVKMVYNGEPDSDGKCGTSRGNHVGYGSRTSQSLSSNYNYGTDYTYDAVSKTFTLSGNLEQATWNSTTYPSLIGKYTCRNTTGSCSTLYYVESYYSNSSAYVLPINSTTIYSFIGRSVFNSNSSSLADVGYMYNKRYPSNKKSITSSTTVYSSSSFGTSYYFADSLIDDGTGKQILDPETTKEVSATEWHDSYDDYKNKFYCPTLDCTTVYYVTSTSDTSMIHVDTANDYMYGNTFTYDKDTGMYTLSGETQHFYDWPNNYSKLGKTHYTCWNTSGVCQQLSYIYSYQYYTSGVYEPYYIDLENGTSVEKALNEMLHDDNVNATNSTIKNMIDLWYSKNMTRYTDYFEDTVWCNSRREATLNGWNPSGGRTSGDLDFWSYTNSSNLTCPDKIDRFTVSGENGNGALTYPVGLVTRPEISLSYSSGNSPLSSVGTNWTLSPRHFRYDAIVESMESIGNSGGDSVKSFDCVRPAVSLRAGIEYESGNGTVDNPYIIDMES